MSDSQSTGNECGIIAPIEYILGIDPGTRCGWAVRSIQEPSGMIAGVWELSTGRFEGGGMRYVRLRSYLVEISNRFSIKRVYFEEVRRHMGVDAAHVYGGIIAEVMAWCEMMKLPYLGIPVGTIKKFACGKGNATKDMMVAAARKKWGHLYDDNEADARWIAECAADTWNPITKAGVPLFREV